MITPSVDVGMEVRTNPAQTDAESVPGASVNVRPGIDIAAEGNDVSFGLGGRYALRKYVQSDYVPLDRYSDFNLDADLDVLKRQVVGFRIRNGMGILGDPNGSIDSQRVLVRYRNNLQGDAVIRIGPTLDIRAGGRWAHDQFWNERQSINQRNTFGPRLASEWRFFPRTAVVFNASYDLHRWGQPEFEGQDGALTQINDSEAVRVFTGLRGRLTEKIVVTTTIGYGAGMYRVDGAIDPESAVKGIDGLLATVQFRYEFTRQQKISLGYEKNFADSIFTNSLAYNSFFVRWNGTYGSARKLSTALQVRPRIEAYKGPIERNDLILNAEARVGYNFQEWAGVHGGVRYNQRASDFATASFTDVNFFVYGSFTY